MKLTKKPVVSTTLSVNTDVNARKKRRKSMQRSCEVRDHTTQRATWLRNAEKHGQVISANTTPGKNHKFEEFWGPKLEINGHAWWSDWSQSEKMSSTKTKVIFTMLTQFKIMKKLKLIAEPTKIHKNTAEIYLPIIFYIASIEQTTFNA